MSTRSELPIAAEGGGQSSHHPVSPQANAPGIQSKRSYGSFASHTSTGSRSEMSPVASRSSTPEAITDRAVNGDLRPANGTQASNTEDTPTDNAKVS